MTDIYQNTDKESNFNVRIYYEDTDAGGIVYHANYLNFAERARCEWLRDMGILCSKLLPEHGFHFVVRHVDISYKAACYLDDLLVVRSSFIDLGNASFTMQQNIWRDDVMVAEIKVVCVCIDIKGRAIRVPQMLREKLEGIIKS